MYSSTVPIFDLRPNCGERFPRCLYKWDSLPRYPFDKDGEVEGQLARKFVLPFFTVNTYTQGINSSGGLQQQGASGSDIKNGIRISYNLVAVGVLL